MNLYYSCIFFFTKTEVHPAFHMFAGTRLHKIENEFVLCVWGCVCVCVGGGGKPEYLILLIA